MDDLNTSLDIESATIDAGQRLLVVSGEVDLHTAPALRAAVESALGDAPSQLVVDLDGVTFIDSSGLAVLIQASRSGRLVLRRPSPAVTLVIWATGLSATFEVDER